jgi:hypothetical protein
MRSMAYSNTAKPTRPVCPRCGKKGIGVWHTIDTFRDRNCRYCNYTVFENFIIEGHEFRGRWVRDEDRMTSYNGDKS